MQKTETRPASKTLPYAWVILVVVYLASVAAPFNFFKIPTIMPVLVQHFNISLAQAGALMSLIALVGLVLALPAGLIMQRFGPRLTILAALGLLTAGSWAGSQAGSFTTLMFSRAIEGLGIGLISVAAPATITAWFPPERQGTPMGLWSTWVPVGSVVMFNLAPRLAVSLGWPAVWWVGAIFPGLVIVLVLLLLKNPPAPAGSGGVGFQNPGPGQAASQAAGLRQALANRNIWLLALSFGFFNLAFLSFGTYYPTFLNQARGYSLDQAAFVASIATLVIIGSSPMAGWFSDQIGSRRLLFSLPYLGLAILMLLPFQVEGQAITAVMITQGILIGAIPTNTLAAVPEIMRRPEWVGIGMAAILIGQNLGQLVGPMMFGTIAYGYGWTVAGLTIVPVCLLAFLSAWWVRAK
jgi:MFS family permease